MRKIVVLAVTLVLAGAACGGGSSRSATPRTRGTTATTATTVPSPERLKAALLSVGEMPAGWATGMGIADDSSTTEASPPAETPSTDEFLCPAGSSLFPRDLSSDNADAPQVEFNKGEMGPFVLEMIGAGPDVSNGFPQMRRAFAACVGQTWETTDDEGTKTTVRLAELSMPKHGDEQAAYRLSGDAGPAMFTADLVIVRTGNVGVIFMSLGLTTLFGGGQPLAPAEFDQIVTAGVEKAGKSA